MDCLKKVEGIFAAMRGSSKKKKVVGEVEVGVNGGKEGGLVDMLNGVLKLETDATREVSILESAVGGPTVQERL